MRFAWLRCLLFRRGSPTLRTKEDQQQLTLSRGDTVLFSMDDVWDIVVIDCNGDKVRSYEPEIDDVSAYDTLVVGLKGEWGSIEAEQVLMSEDGSTLTVPAPVSMDGPTLSGDGWTVTLASGWIVRPGSRSGDFQLVREDR